MAKVTFRDFGLTRAFKEAAPNLRDEIAKTLNKEGQRASARMVKFASAGGRRNLRIRSGQLTKSLHYLVQRKANATSVSIGTIKRTEALAYAGIHEFGGTIRPTRSKYLTIPLDRAKTPSGNPRFTAREAEQEFEETWFARSKKGRLMLWGMESDASVYPLFLLVKQVKIKPRPFVQPAFKEMQHRVRTDIRDVLQRALDRR